MFVSWIEAIFYLPNSLDADALTQMGSDHESIIFNALWHQPTPSAEGKKAAQRCRGEDSLSLQVPSLSLISSNSEHGVKWFLLNATPIQFHLLVPLFLYYKAEQVLYFPAFFTIQFYKDSVFVFPVPS